MDGTEPRTTGSNDPAEARELEAFRQRSKISVHTRCCRGKEITVSADHIRSLRAEQLRDQVGDLAEQLHCHRGER